MASLDENDTHTDNLQRTVQHIAKLCSDLQKAVQCLQSEIMKRDGAQANSSNSGPAATGAGDPTATVLPNTSSTLLHHKHCTLATRQKQSALGSAHVSLPHRDNHSKKKNVAIVDSTTTDAVTTPDIVEIADDDDDATSSRSRSSYCSSSTSLTSAHSTELNASVEGIISFLEDGKVTKRKSVDHDGSDSPVMKKLCSSGARPLKSSCVTLGDVGHIWRLSQKLRHFNDSTLRKITLDEELGNGKMIHEMCERIGMTFDAEHNVIRKGILCRSPTLLDVEETLIRWSSH